MTKRVIKYIVRRQDSREITRENHLVEARRCGNTIPTASYITRRQFEEENGREVCLLRETYISVC